MLIYIHFSGSQNESLLNNSDPADQLHLWNAISKRVAGKVRRVTMQSPVITDHCTGLRCVFIMVHFVTLQYNIKKKQNKIRLTTMQSPVITDHCTGIRIFIMLHFVTLQYMSNTRCMCTEVDENMMYMLEKEYNMRVVH